MGDLRRIFTRNKLIVGVFLLALFLRLYHLNQNFVFGVDEEYQAYLAQTIVRDFHLIWIGVGSTADFYLGPLWTYLTAFLLFVSKGSPLITGYFSSLLGSVTVVSIYFVGKKMAGKTVGVAASLIYATLPLFVFYDQKFWNVSPAPFLSLVMFYSLLSLKRQLGWLVIFALAFGLVFHTHLSLLFWGPVAILWIFFNRLRINKVIWLTSTIAFLAVYSPLLVFDYFHNWSNLTTPIRLVTGVKQQPEISFSNRVADLGNYLGRVWYLGPNQNNADEVNWGCTYSQTISPNLLKVLSVVLLIVFLLSPRTWKNERQKLLAITLLVFLLTYFVFPGNTYEYYLLGFFPLYLFIPAVLFGRKKLGLFVLAVICCLGLRTILTAKNDYGLGIKRELVGEVMKTVGKKPFSLSSEGKCHIAEGWRYLFSVYGRKPERSDTDKIFGWLYANEITTRPAVYRVTVYESRLFSFNGRENVIEKGGFATYLSRM